MIYEQINLEVDVQKPKEHLAQKVLPLPPKWLGNVFGGWSVTPAEGNGYLVDVSRPHKAVNYSANDRYRLIMDVWDTRHISKNYRYDGELNSL